MVNALKINNDILNIPYATEQDQPRATFMEKNILEILTVQEK